MTEVKGTKQFEKRVIAISN